MKTDIILAGVGGQGILSIAAALGAAAVKNNLFLKQAETHGMSQRGGAVQSHLRISDKEIFSDLISHGQAELILSVEPMEALRYLPYLVENGWIVTNSIPFINIPDYPEVDTVLALLKTKKNCILIDSDKLAKDAGFAKSSNIVMLGAASPFIDIDIKEIEEGIRMIFGAKGQNVVDANLKALQLGRDFAENYAKK
jgi:indolepyruvate ferredoxin oxidoreductase, beta subunit